jgi:hypothetical protein
VEILDVRGWNVFFGLDEELVFPPWIGGESHLAGKKDTQEPERS